MCWEGCALSCVVGAAPLGQVDLIPEPGAVQSQVLAHLSRHRRRGWAGPAGDPHLGQRTSHSRPQGKRSDRDGTGCRACAPCGDRHTQQARPPWTPGEEGGPGQVGSRGTVAGRVGTKPTETWVSWGVMRLGEDPRTQDAGSGDLDSACSCRAVGPVPVSSCVCLQAALSVLTLVESRYPWCRGPRFAVRAVPCGRWR